MYRAVQVSGIAIAALTGRQIDFMHISVHLPEPGAPIL